MIEVTDSSPACTKSRSSSNLRHLDQRLCAELDRYLLPRPPYGWVRSLRLAIGLSGFELGTRLGVGQPRISQIEHGPN